VSADVLVSRFAGLDTTTLYRILRLRAEVFAVEQDCAYNDLDGRDAEDATVHLWVDIDPDAPTVASAGRLLTDADGTRVLGRVVTAPDHRHRRLASGLIDRAVALVPNGATVVLNAQLRLEPWYGRWGFVRTGAAFLEDGIPHVPMARPGR
jgi:ElaA protein